MIFAPYAPIPTLHFTFSFNVATSPYPCFLSWFNNIHRLKVNLSRQQILSTLTDETTELTSIQKRRRDLLLLLAKYYKYTCKTLSKKPGVHDFQTKTNKQWKIEKLTATSLPTLSFFLLFIMSIVMVPVVY